MTTVISGVLWTLGALAVIAGVWSKMYGIPAIGLLCAGAGGVLNIRGFVMRCEERMESAFQCGRDYEKAKSGVRAIH